MPIYEYKCTECDHRLEKLQKMSDDPIRDCPQCGKSALTKLVSATSFKLKGSGWYETDFKNKKKPDTPSSDNSKGEGGSTKTKTASEPSKSTSKPDVKK